MSVRSYQEILTLIDEVDVKAYAQTRNHLDGAVSRLSPYISRGVITLPFVRDRILARSTKTEAEKFIQELAWREYFQRVWWTKADGIFSDLRFARTDWRHAELVTGMVEANTGITVIDQIIKKLYDTGHMHNHARLWVAAMACNIAKAHWYEMGRWLYAHLLDGDLASNFLSWQWVAGTSVQKRYTMNQALINACSGDDQVGSWLDIDREATLVMSLPTTLITSESFYLTTNYPENDMVSVADQTVCLYTPWTLDPLWRREQSSRRILVIDPVWFDRFPVSDLVLDFIIRQGQTVIPNLEVYSGEIEAIPGLKYASQIHYRRHQTNLHWPGNGDEPEYLYPEVTGYYPSFYAFWQATQQPGDHEQRKNLE
jgi:deoxyribodipyrimidine photo-lyase